MKIDIARLIGHQQIRTLFKNRYVQIAAYVLPFVLLLIVIAITSIPTNHYFSHIQDDVLYRYLFQDFKLHDIVVPTNHANILKYPLYILQAILPYNTTTLAVVNFSLVYAMTIPLVFLFTYTLGHKYFPLISTLFASLFLSSVAFNVNIMETTIRNIEYPIGIAFLLALSIILKRGLTKRTVIIGALTSILMAAAISGDSLLLYVFCGAPIVATVLYAIRYKAIKKNQLIIVCCIIATVILAILIRKIIAFSGIVSYFLSPQFETRIAPFELMAPGLERATDQLMTLFGADIFGLPVSPGYILFFTHFFLLLIGITGIVAIITSSLTTKNNTRKKEVKNNFDYSFFTVSLALSAVIVFAAYIVAGQVVTFGADGTIINAHQERYITLVPIVVVFGVVYIFKHYYDNKLFRYATILCIIAVMIISAPKALLNYDPYVKGADARHTNALMIAQVAKENKLDLIVTSDNMGAVIQLQSGNALPYAPLISCDQWFPYNTRMSWQGIADTRSINKTGLVIDRSGIDSPIWSSCSDERIVEIYGTPDSKVFSKNTLGTGPLETWIYSKDIRQELNKSAQ